MAILKPRARIIRTIGDQLISGPEAALIELVKNAYDADSSRVAIKISPPSSIYPAGRIVVSDRGHGMTYDDIEGRWFEPASDDKAQLKNSPGGRIMLGAKGIGRFAAARLGSQLTLESVAELTRGRQEKITVLVDWEEFTAERYLSDVDIPIDRQVLNPGSTTKTGVKLTITRLREVWTEKRLNSLVRELRRLVSPTEVADDFTIRLDLSDFEGETSDFDGRDVLRRASRDVSSDDLVANDPWRVYPFAIQDFADYRVRGQFSSNGAFRGSYVNYKGDHKSISFNLPAPAREPEETDCGSFKIRINIYDRESDSVERLFERMGADFSKIGIRAAREILTESAGIAIFRNGFRIRPYGAPDHDWLELERQRVQDPSRKLGLSQVAGRIDISSEDESKLIERSSREGLEHNGAYERLKHLMQEVLLWVEAERLEFREKAGLSRKRTPNVSEARDIARLRATTRAAARLPAAERKTMLEAVERDVQSLEKALDEIEEYQKVLTSRAALGLVVAEVLHEGRRLLNPVATSAGALSEQGEWLIEISRRGDVARKQLPEHVTVISTGARSISQLFRRLDPLSGRKRGRPRTFGILDQIKTSKSLMDQLLRESGISVAVAVDDDLQAYGYIEDFQAAVLNLLENAIYWLGTTTQRRKEISIAGASSRRKVRISVSNNGPEIDPLHHQKLFTPGFTLKRTGTGLGLAIAREACRASKGDLDFDPEAEDTTFIIEFPVPTD